MDKDILTSSKNTNNIVEPIINYLNEEKSDYCVLINGRWGCGKTFYIKNRLQEEVLNNVGRKLVYISLFGTNTIEDLYTSILLGISSAKGVDLFNEVKENNDAVRGGAEFLKDNRLYKCIGNISFKGILLKGLKQIPGFKNIEVFSKDVLEGLYFFDDYCIVLDDFERSNINRMELFGVLDILADQNGAKVIIVSNDDKIKDVYNDDEQNKRIEETKEKVIGLRVNFNYDLEKAYDDVLSSLQLDDSVKEILIEYKKEVVSLFDKCESANIRTLIFALKRFSSIYNSVTDLFNKLKNDICHDEHCVSEDCVKSYLLLILRNIIGTSIIYREKGFRNNYEIEKTRSAINIEKAYNNEKTGAIDLYGDKTITIYKEIDSYVYDYVLDTNGLRNHIVQHILECKNNIEYYVSQANNVYYSATDEDAINKLKVIEKEIIDNKIYVNAYPRIIGILFNLYQILLTDEDLEKLKGCILSNVEKSAQDFNYKDWYFISEGNSEAIKFNTALHDKMKESHRKLEDKRRKVLFESDKEPVESFREYLEFQHISPINNQSLFYDVTPEELINKVLSLKPIEVRDIRCILNNKYNFVNVKNFYKNDAEFFEKCHGLLESELLSKKNIRGKLCAHFLESLLNEFKNLYAKLS